MPTVRFLGKVLPLVVRTNVTDLPTVSWEEPPLGILFSVKISITNSIVDVWVEVNKFEARDFDTLHMRAFDLVRACVNTMAFSTGYSLTVHFENAVWPDGSIRKILIENPSLRSLCTFAKFPTVTIQEKRDFESATKLVMQEPALYFALNDLIQANSLPHEAPINCGRVLDGLRKIVAPTLKPSQGWPVLQSTVNSNEAYMRYVSDLSTNPRHGDRSYIPGTETSEALRRTWTIMNRFIEYRTRGNQALSLSIFPLLIG